MTQYESAIDELAERLTGVDVSLADNIADILGAALQEWIEADVYGFLLTAVDSAVHGGGTVDAFRTKIWDRTTGETVYDNKTGSQDTTSLSGGSIVIHSK